MPLAHHVAQAGIEGLAVVGVGRLDVPEVVRIVGPEAEAVVAALLGLVPVVDGPGGQHEVLVAQELGRGEVEIEPGQRVLLARRAAVGEDEADLALVEDVLGHPGGQKVAGGQVDAPDGRGPRLDVEHGQVGAPDLAVDLGPQQDGDLRPLVEPDGAAEEGGEADARAEAEVLRAFEEEHPLLREEHREAGQVDAALVDLGLGEVHVVADDADEVGRDALVEVEAAVEVAVVLGRNAVRPGGAGQAVGLEGDAQPLLDVLDALEGGRLVGIVEIAVQGRAGEADLLHLPGDRPLDVEAPGGQPGPEGDGLEGDADLGRPAVGERGGSWPPRCRPS